MVDLSGKSTVEWGLSYVLTEPYGGFWSRPPPWEAIRQNYDFAK